MALTAIDILNTIRDNATLTYQTRVPQYTRDNLGQVGQAITSDSNIMNEYISALVNKISLSNVKSKIYNNKLSILKGAGVPYGSTIEEIYINPSTDAGYDTDGTKLLKTTKADGKVCYYGLNRKSSYPVTINQVQLERGFTSEQEYMTLYNGIIASLYSGDNIDEFMLTKGVLGKAIDAGGMTILECDISSPKEVSKAITNCSKAFTFPQTSFNGYNLTNANVIAETEPKCITFTESTDQCLIMRADVETEIGYEVLATMFNKSATEIEAMTILVDAFPSTTHDVYAILCDRDAVQVRDTVYTIKSQEIGSNLTWNFWLHHWQFLFLSMFGNCVAFGKKIVQP